jgi:hypothetical protein
VPPSAIDYCCSLRLDVGLGRVQGGDWDRDRTELRETTTYRGLVQRFVDGQDWEETALYRRAKDSFDSGAGQYRGYGSLEAFREKRLAYIDDLYESIDTEGYHRLIVAGILGVEEIPVYVLCRHEEWQHVRDRIARVGADSPSGRLAQHHDHPDIPRLR